MLTRLLVSRAHLIPQFGQGTAVMTGVATVLSDNCMTRAYNVRDRALLNRNDSPPTGDYPDHDMPCAVAPLYMLTGLRYPGLRE